MIKKVAVNQPAPLLRHFKYAYIVYGSFNMVQYYLTENGFSI